MAVSTLSVPEFVKNTRLKSGPDFARRCGW